MSLAQRHRAPVAVRCERHISGAAPALGSVESGLIPVDATLHVQTHGAVFRLRDAQPIEVSGSSFVGSDLRSAETAIRVAMAVSATIAVSQVTCIRGIETRRNFRDGCHVT